MSKSLIGKLLVKVRTLNKGYVQVLHQDNLGLHAGTHFDHAACSYSVTQARHAFYLGAMLAAEEGAFLFESVTDNMNPAIPAGRGQRMDCTLEAVERVSCAIHGHLECLVVVVSAGFASSHDGLRHACSALNSFFVEGGAMNFIEKSAIATNEYWLRVYRSCPNFAQ